MKIFHKLPVGWVGVLLGFAAMVMASLDWLPSRVLESDPVLSKIGYWTVVGPLLCGFMWLHLRWTLWVVELWMILPFFTDKAFDNRMAKYRVRFDAHPLLTRLRQLFQKILRKP